MENKSIHVEDQSVMPDIFPQITDDILEKLEWQDTNENTFIGFFVKSTLPSSGPEGTAVFFGFYPHEDENTLFALSVYFNDGEMDETPAGLCFQRARVKREVQT